MGTKKTTSNGEPRDGFKVTFEIKDSDYATIFGKKNMSLSEAIKQLQRFDAKKSNGASGKVKKGKDRQTGKKLFAGVSFDVGIGSAFAQNRDADEEEGGLEREFSSIVPKQSGGSEKTGGLFG